MEPRRSRRTPVLTAVILVLVTGCFAAASASELDGPGVLGRLQDWLDGTEDFEGSFEQELISGALGSGMIETGRILVLRPGGMHWDYLDPERKVAIVDGKRTRLYIEEDRQLWEGRLEETDALLPELLASESSIGEVFRPSLLATPSAGGGGAYRLRLLPRSRADSFEEVVVTLRPPGFAIEQVEVLDAAGNRVHYRFFGIERNGGLSPAALYFEAPPGTEILAQP